MPALFPEQKAKNRLFETKQPVFLFAPQSGEPAELLCLENPGRKVGLPETSGNRADCHLPCCLKINLAVPNPKKCAILHTLANHSIFNGLLAFFGENCSLSLSGMKRRRNIVKILPPEPLL